MPLPSSLTLGSLAFVVVAGVGLVSVSSSASEDPEESGPAAAAPPTHRRDPSRAQPANKHQREPQGSARAKPDDAVPKMLVAVYKNSGITGLGERKSALLEGAGWQVAETDNWYGEIVANTVYYPPHHKPQAEQLAKVLGVTRLMPSVAPMQFDRLTVIFTQA